MISNKYKDLYDKMLEHYKEVHVNPWHEITEEKLNDIYYKLVNSMDINSESSFCYFINYIIKRLSGSEDAHTQYVSKNFIPMNFRIFGNEVLVNFPNELKGNKLISINETDIVDILNELDDITTYGILERKVSEY